MIPYLLYRRKKIWRSFQTSKVHKNPSKLLTRTFFVSKSTHFRQPRTKILPFFNAKFSLRLWRNLSQKKRAKNGKFASIFHFHSTRTEQQRKVDLETIFDFSFSILSRSFRNVTHSKRSINTCPHLTLAKSLFFW